MKNSLRITVLGLATLALTSNDVLAMDQIVRPFQSVRSSGMGGTLLTTGMYEDHFYGNPAQVTQDPKWKVQAFDLTAETTTSTIQTGSDIAGGGDELLKKIANTAGGNNHGRIQTAFPAVYLPRVGGTKTSVAFALLANTQLDLSLRKSFRIEPQAYADIGPAITVGRTFLPGNELAVGLTGHATYRLASKSGFTLGDFIRGVSLSPTENGGEAARVDFDFGARYLLPWKTRGYEFSVGAVVHNIRGGGNNVDLQLFDTGLQPEPQARTLSVGASVRKPTLWRFTNAVLAFDVRDMGGNTHGSVYRLIHLGAEAQWKVLKPRIGINQGYLTAGLGVHLKFFQLELATYGEEMSLNAGGLEDRRFALRIGFEI